MSRGGDVTGQSEFAVQSPAHAKRGSVSAHPDSAVVSGQDLNAEPLVDKSVYKPQQRRYSSHGGFETFATSGILQQGLELERLNLVYPNVMELGNIDILALTRSLQSGIHGEVRLALDTLTQVSNSPHQHHLLQLRYCDDLLDALIDCAEEQVDLLAESTVEVSDEIQLTPYEDVVRSCRVDQWAVKEMDTFGSPQYELDRAVDRLICITTILRNTSFPGEQNDNHAMLAEEHVVKFLCAVIRYMGTRTMLLRTHRNTLDFMKDIVTLLSNVASAIEIPGREQALCLLQFLLSFAPSPSPVRTDNGIIFTPFDPSVHPYLPHAVDALAKLFARDEPNRTHYKALFALDANGTPAYELLHRTFALAIAPIPDKVQEHRRPKTFPSMVETRKPFLMQGLLAAEIIASLAPGPDSGVAAAWLSPANELGQTLFDLIQRLSKQYEQSGPPGRNARTMPRKDPELVYITVTAVSLLKRLAEKARDPGASSNPLPFLPSSQALLEVTSLPSPEWTKEGFLQHMTACFNLTL